MKSGLIIVVRRVRLVCSQIHEVIAASHVQQVMLVQLVPATCVQSAKFPAKPVQAAKCALQGRRKALVVMPVHHAKVDTQGQTVDAICVRLGNSLTLTLLRVRTVRKMKFLPMHSAGCASSGSSRTMRRALVIASRVCTIDLMG